MAGTLSIQVQEARGFTAIPADIDQLAVVMGCSSSGEGLSSFFLSGASAQTEIGYGDASDTLCQIIEQRLSNGNGTKYPAAFCKVAAGTDGSYGTLDDSAITGTCEPAEDTSLDPFGTYQAGVKIIDDGNDGAGTAIGTSGILYQTTLDGGVNWSRTRALGTGTSIAIANTGVRWLLNPPTGQTSVYVTYINAIRTAALAHFPYTTGGVHGAADSTSDDGIGAVATNIATGITLNGQILTALALHFARGSTVHTTADVTTSLAAAQAAQAAAVASGAAQDAFAAALLTETALETHEANTSVHAVADATNVVSATRPTRGTLFTDDVWYQRTLAPVPGSDDIDDAFDELASRDADFRILVCDWPMTATLAARITAGLNALENVGKRPTAIVRVRVPDFETSESEAAWLASVAADFASFTDSRILVRAGYGLVTDAMTGNQYLRSTLQQFAADVVRSPRGRWPCAPSDPVTGLAGEPNVSLVDADGVLVGHDEGPGGGVAGLSNDTLGNRFSCEQRILETGVRNSVFNTVPWVMYAADERVRNLMVRRIANSMKSVAIVAGLPALGSHVFYTRTSPTTGTLKPESRKSLQSAIYAAVSGEFKNDIDNASDAAIDTGLVQVAAGVTISGGNLVSIAVTLAPSIGGYVVKLNVTLAIQE